MTAFIGVAAVDEGGCIGDSRVPGGIPWRHEEDLRRLRALCEGQPILVGHRTHELAPRWIRRTAHVVAAADEALEVTRGLRVAYVLGGARTYATLAPLVSTWLITRIPGRHGGDAWMPDIGPTHLASAEPMTGGARLETWVAR
jgi:dihydrofolate reductase